MKSQHAPFLTAAMAAVILGSSPAAAQSGQLPSGLAEIETNRSRSCVDIFRGLQELDSTLAPLAERGQRLIRIGEAVSIEDDLIVEELDRTDALEARVADWFASDQELARRYVATLAQQLVTQRATAREEMLQTLRDAVGAIQAEADSVVAATDDLPARATPCDGAIFVRPAVVEACASATLPICEAARETDTAPFRFVDAAEQIWDVYEVRPWSAPTPLRVNQQGQLDGARTVTVSRTGNVVVSVAFSPVMRDRAELTPEELSRFAATNDSLGITLDHPELAVAPSLGVRATLPQPLGGETTYALHFGPPDSAEVVWTGQAGTGAVLAGTVPLTASHVTRLGAGEALTFSALSAPSPADGATIYAFELATVNQAQASQALLRYMTTQLGQDLQRIVGPGGG